MVLDVTPSFHEALLAVKSGALNSIQSMISVEKALYCLPW